jgi:exonuclease VII large subunit
MHAHVLLIALSLLGQLQQTGATPEANSDSLEIRYARAQLQLAEANLTRVQQSNRRVPRSVPGSVVAEYQREVDVARKRLEQATAGKTASEFQVWLRRAQAEQESADTAWKNATAVNSRDPGAFDPLDVERFRLRAEVAKLEFQRGQKLADDSREAQLQWEADLLDNKLRRLEEESSNISPVVRLYPYQRSR